ncbi:MAG: glycosyltransferase family 4 protein [Acidimicrobiia bacterium]|nr:glycosyltransferase family 4 protein [Acidimicrobiia bacterium]
MRVLMLAWDLPTRQTGGIAAHIDGLGQALARAGHEVVLLTLGRRGAAEEAEQGAIRILRARADLPWLPDDDVVARAASANHHIVALLTRLRDWRPDVVHAHDWHVAWAAHTLAALHGSPLVATFHGTERGQHGGRVPPGLPSTVHAVESWLAHASTDVIASSKFMVNEVIDGFEVAADRTHRIPNGIDPIWWTTRDDDAVPSNPPLVLTWGRVQYEKGFQVLGRAMSLLRPRLAGVECIIGGRGSFLPELQSQIDIDGVSDIVHLPGFVPDERLRSLIQRSGCVAIPSLYEPFGIVALEALAGGAPIVAARTGGLAELLDGTGAGLLFEPGNADELASCIERVLTDAELADDMRRRGAELLADHYSWDAIAAATAAVYTADR